MYQQAPFVQITSCYRCLKLTSHFRERSCKAITLNLRSATPQSLPFGIQLVLLRHVPFGTSQIKTPARAALLGARWVGPSQKDLPLAVSPTVFKTKTSEGIRIFSLYSQSCISQQSLIQPHPSTALTRTSTLSWGWPQPIFGDPKARSSFLCFVSSAWERAVTY